MSVRSTVQAGQGSATASSPPMSPEIAAQVKQALAPAAAGAQKLGAALSQGQASLSGLGQLKSALAAFQTTAGALTSDSMPAAGADPASQMQSFAAAYNTLNSQLQTLQQGTLKSDAGLGQVHSQLASMVNGASAKLAAVGVTIDSHGVMQVDKTRLADAVQATPASVGRLLAPAGDGLVSQLAERAQGFISGSGVVARESASTGKQVETLSAKQATLSHALTAQASALAAFYTQQANAGAGGSSSLFDMLA
jgi:flagellar hook-associated protein 2